jgi:regulator of protease activity HflC (stomatin/prohibitin superfamily)
MSRTVCLLCAVFLSSGCATVIEGHERGLYYSAGQGLQHDLVGSGWHWHLPWNHFTTYDLRWNAHEEEVHIHSKDNLHLNVTLAAVVRPIPAELYQLETEVGPRFYEELVRPAIFAAARDASARFTHLQIATQTHEYEEAVQGALTEHLKGKHLELEAVAVQHFDLPPDVEAMAAKKAAAEQQLVIRDVDLRLAEREAQLDQNRRKAAVETAGLEKRLRAQQELDQAELETRIAEERRAAQRVQLQAETEAVTQRAKAEAEATRTRADAEKARLAAVNQNLSPNYVRLQALEAMGKAMSGDHAHVYVLPTGKDGLPAFFAPFLNPYGPAMTAMSGALGDDRPVAPKSATP